MSTNSKTLIRKYSLKIYRSPRLLHYPIPENSEAEKVKKEEPTQKNYNINKIESQQNQNQGNITSKAQQQTKIYSNTIPNKRNLSTEEKKVKIPISAKNSIKLNNKGEIAIKPSNGNNSGTKIISTVRESHIQNKYINTNNNQPLFYSNIDLSNHNKNINKSFYINGMGKTYDEKNQYRANSQAKPQITKVVHKINSNNSSNKIRTNNDPKNTKDRRIPHPIERNNITNINVSKINNIQVNFHNNSRQNTVYISGNNSHRSSKIYQDKDINKTFNTSSNNPSNLRQMTQKIKIPNIQNKSYRTEYNSTIQTHQINIGKNIKNNNQAYYISQAGKRQEKSNNKAQKINTYIPDNRNGKGYNTKDNKSQINYDKNKNYHIYDSKNINKENYDKNRAGFNYVVNINNTNLSFNGNKYY